MAIERTVLSGGVRLAVHDHGGPGRPVVLLHGLAGHSGEWDTTAAWMSEGHRVIAVDQRGHGASERHPADVSSAAYVADAIAVIKELRPEEAGDDALNRSASPTLSGSPTGSPVAADDHRLEPVVLVGQSMGGHTAMLVAAARPDLVRALVMVEASPGLPDAGAVADVERWLASWPVPFPSPDAAARFFGGGAAGSGWAAGLEERGDGWWPRFDLALMVRSLTDGPRRSSWREWERVACPTLVVVAGSGIIPSVDVGEMTRTRPDAVMAHIPGAGHDVHLEAPDLLRSALEDFLEAL